jgi:hypothetical protein
MNNKRKMKKKKKRAVNSTLEKDWLGWWGKGWMWRSCLSSDSGKFYPRSSCISELL